MQSSGDFSSSLGDFNSLLMNSERPSYPIQESSLRPALGTAWYHTVNVRILMFVADEGSGIYTRKHVDENDICTSTEITESFVQRYFSICKSPLVRKQTIPYSIGAAGIIMTPCS